MSLYFFLDSIRTAALAELKIENLKLKKEPAGKAASDRAEYQPLRGIEN
jgi:hypothetical protein